MAAPPIGSSNFFSRATGSATNMIMENFVLPVFSLPDQFFGVSDRLGVRIQPTLLPVLAASALLYDAIQERKSPHGNPDRWKDVLLSGVVLSLALDNAHLSALALAGIVYATYKAARKDNMLEQAQVLATLGTVLALGTAGLWAGKLMRIAYANQHFNNIFGTLKHPVTKERYQALIEEVGKLPYAKGLMDGKEKNLTEMLKPFYDNLEGFQKAYQSISKGTAEDVGRAGKLLQGHKNAVTEMRQPILEVLQKEYKTIVGSDGQKRVVTVMEQLLEDLPKRPVFRASAEEGAYSKKALQGLEKYLKEYSRLDWRLGLFVQPLALYVLLGSVFGLTLGKRASEKIAKESPELAKKQLLVIPKYLNDDDRVLLHKPLNGPFSGFRQSAAPYQPYGSSYNQFGFHNPGLLGDYKPEQFPEWVV